MKYLSLMLKGFIIGIAKIIPGVSGAVIAISFGVYERLIKIISKPLHLSFNDLKFLFFLMTGSVLGIGIFCKGVKWCLEAFYLPTILLFSGLIIGGVWDVITEIKKNKFCLKNVWCFLLCFGVFYYVINLPNINEVYDTGLFVYFLIGVTESITTIIPGISGTAIFMALGLYDVVLRIYESISTFDIKFNVLFMFFLGFIFSTVAISKIITYLFENKKTLAYSGVLGFMFASLLEMFSLCFSTNFSYGELTIGILLLAFGILANKKINDFFSKF